MLCSQISVIQIRGPTATLTHRYLLYIYCDLCVVQVHKVGNKRGRGVWHRYSICFVDGVERTDDHTGGWS